MLSTVTVFLFSVTQKGYNMSDIESIDLLVSLMGISNKDTQVVIFSSIMKSLKAITETPTTKIRIRDKYKKKSKIIECSIRECLEKYINVDIEEKWQKYDISDWRFGLEKKTDYMEC